MPGRYKPATGLARLNEWAAAPLRPFSRDPQGSVDAASLRVAAKRRRVWSLTPPHAIAGDRDEASRSRPVAAVAPRGMPAGGGSLRAADADPAALSAKALAVLNANCHRCHGQDGTAEGGMNFILDPAKLVARKKIVPGQPDQSPLFKRVSAGKMPPSGETAAAVGRRRRRSQAVDRGRRPAADAGRPPARPDRRGRVQPHPRRPGPAGQTRPALPPLFQPGPAGQRRLRPRRAADLPQRPGQAAQQPLLAPAHHPARRPSTRTARAADRPARLPVGRDPVEPAAGRVPLRRPRTTPPRPGPSSSARPRACRACGPTGSSPTPRGRRSTTICCKSRPICRNWSGSCASMWRPTCSRSAWRGPASSAPASRATTASSNGTTP